MAATQDIRSTNSPPTIKDYIQVGPVRTYYEAEGRGEALVLLHGGMCSIETFGQIRPALAARFRLYLPERRGTGRTSDVEGPYTHAALAADTIGFMEAVGIESAHLAGWSNGGMVALHVAAARPDLLRSLVIIEAPANHDGDPAPVAELIKLEHPPAGFLPPMLRDLYSAVSPDGPDHYDVVLEKFWQMMRVEPNLALEALSFVKSPALVIQAEHSMVTREHAAAVAEALPAGRLTVVPGAGHALPLENARALTDLMLEFLG